MPQVKRIIELRVSKKSKRMIAQILGISRNTLDNYLTQLSSHQADLSTYLSWTEEQLVQLLSTPAPRTSLSYPELYTLFPSYTKELKRVGVSRMTLWTEYNLVYPLGVKYRQFCFLFHRWQATASIVMVYPSNL